MVWLLAVALIVLFWISFITLLGALAGETPPETWRLLLGREDKP